MIGFRALSRYWCTNLQTSVICVLMIVSLLPNSVAAGEVSVGGFIRTLKSCHPELRASALRVEMAGVALQQVDAGRLPSFSVSADGFTQSGERTAQLQLTVTAPIATFGVLPAKKELEAARLELQRVSHSKEVRSHAERLISATISLFYLDEKIALLQEILELKGGLNEQMKRRLALGNASNADVLQVEASLAQNQARRNNLQIEAFTADQEIRTLQCIGMDVRQIVLDLQPIIQSYNGGVLRSVEFIEAERKVAVLQSELNLERLSNRPTLQLEGSAALNNNGHTAPRVGISTTFEYQNLGRSQSFRMRDKDLKLQEAVLDVAKVQQEQEQRLVIIEEQLMFLTAQALPQRQASILNLEEQLASSQRLFDGGRITMNELLSSYDELSTAKIDLVEMRKQIDLLQLEKFFLVGGA
jgi:outer membrane protein TolC